MDANQTRSRDSIADVWGPRTPYFGQWPSRVDEKLIEEPDHWVKSACVLCSNCCGMDIGVKDGRMVGVRGRAGDQINRGRLGPKGMNGWMANGSADRLKQPLIRRGTKLEEASWEEAMSLIASRSRELMRDYTANTLAFYNTGQLFLEEYYTLGLIALGGIGTTNIDANTRFCTATAETALRESFGTDGQPGCYADFDTADALFHIGHNVASQQTVLWMRILDRLSGPNPPRLVVVDPRRTETARHAHLHIAPRLGTNLALMNGLLHLVIRKGYIDRPFIDAHTLGFETLAQTVAKYPPARVAEICGVPPAQLEEAAEILGSTPRLVSTVLQGVYQSLHASAAAVQVNNLHLIRGMIGKPGCTVFQMNGQPSAQNTRECGADGSYPTMLNWENTAHMQRLAQAWNVALESIPCYTEPTHAMEIFRRAEGGSIRFLWIMGTNPAVSAPDLPRMRRILGKPGLFVVVQDAFLTETAEFADVVLPAAMWGEKTGTYTNADRTVHISHKAVEPPGEARPDFDILLDYTRRLGLRDKDGAPLIKWSTPEQAFDAWRALTQGRPCDYSGMSYAKLTGSDGIHWPCNQHFPDGRERLYTDGVFNTDPDYCQTYGHTMLSGSEIGETLYRAEAPGGRAFLKPADYEPPPEAPDSEYPLWVTSGRVVYHWHTRTKTGRVEALNRAAPDSFVQMAQEDAASLGIGEHDWVEVRTRRGRITARARIGDIRKGHLFVPFHYGYWDRPDRYRAEDELTLPNWDPVSKQPYLKFAAAHLSRLKDQPVSATLTNVGHDVLTMMDKQAYSAAAPVRSATTPARPGQHIPVYLGMVQGGEKAMAASYEAVAARHLDDAAVVTRCREFARRSREDAQHLQPLAARYGSSSHGGADALRSALFAGPRRGNLGLLEDLHSLNTLTAQLKTGYFALKLAGSALKNSALVELAAARMDELTVEEHWLHGQIRAIAAQALVVPTLL